MNIISGSQALKGALLVAFALLTGCGEDSALVGERIPNTPPDTRVTVSPPVLAQTSFTVDFFWTGSDPDGEIAAFEWRISNNGVDGIIDVADTLGLPWNETSVTDSTFIVTADADSFPGDSGIDPPFNRYWQTHTFFIRSVDEEGSRDPSPAHVSFTATTLAPTVRISLPSATVGTSCTSAPRTMTFGWEGIDPDKQDELPEEVRYLLKPYGGPLDGCLTRQQYELGFFPISAEDPEWSPWIKYEAPEDSGKIITLPRQDLGNTFVFAVQVRDVAGAVTPTFTWGRNLRHVSISPSNNPTLTVVDQFLGSFTSVSPNFGQAREIVAGQPIELEWAGNADSYAGLIEAYRYGWDLVDPDDENDPGWAVGWGLGPQWQRALSRSFTRGSHNFVVQTRDNSGTISRLILNFQVIPIPARADQRPLLFVDDFPLNSENVRPLQELWLGRVAGLLDPVVGFQSTDILDLDVSANRFNFGLIANYRAVIWMTSPSSRAKLQELFAPANNTTPRYNWLEVYQARVGNFLLMGPGAAVNSVERVGGAAWKHPMVFNTSLRTPNGFGVERRPDGSEFNRGTIRWPYTGFCLEAVTTIRPGLGAIDGEGPGSSLRELDCSGLYKATVDTAEFFNTYSSAEGEVVDLQPEAGRTTVNARQSPYQVPFEEFYNANTTGKDVQLVLRDCQTPMFRWFSREQAGLSSSECDDLDERVPGKVTGLVSTSYSETKQLKNSADFLWGFHPLGFEDQQVQRALLWIFQSQWQLLLE